MRKKQVEGTWMHRARHLAAENNGGGIRDSLMNSFSNVGIGDVMKRRR